ncbi:MAG: MarR family winged helix-turn-helix transcriptional regulator [Acidimicrobiales bacterium]
MNYFGAVRDDRKAVRNLARVARLLERATGGLSLTQYRVLATVDDGGERATHLANALAMAKPTVTGAVDGLVERGMLTRQAVPGDRRSLRIALTAAGVVALREAESAMADRLADVAGPDLVGRLAELGPALDALRATWAPR